MFDGDMVVFSAARNDSERNVSLRQSWRRYVAGHIAVHPVDCTHQEMLTAESLARYGDQLKHSLLAEDPPGAAARCDD
ncbi:linear gramicidin synthetase subunit D domain protein [Mycobacterium xenopi 4042]|uniref:Linear gramicidin synthetase subunit D domain protein n=1 Tax=Mycobacterium xenopi 4042 TaxID=1299334 RepID=X8DAH5_MYCXE|nr:linear gramicidin synthetase subunit D domain protein [Mycobacterium xenopi 4042]